MGTADESEGKMLSSFLSGMRWQDVIDITLNSYILFRLYILFRGTTVFRIITGIVALWCFQRVAFAFGLIVTSWVLQSFTAVAAFIIIIVFRNEIRSVLQAKNLKAILWGFSNETSDTPIRIVVDSVFYLAEKGCGALIVLPGKEDLRDFVRGGIPWHGVLSREMLTTIFWHDNPVHDGAVIIKGNQVTRVGVILPLSERENVMPLYNDAFPSYFGTRHRAAAGLAEATDALVIVVSEERHDISVARGSEVIQIRDKDELTGIIREHSGVHARETGFRTRKRLEITAAALASFLFITGVWFSFSQGLDTMITLDVPVEYMNRAPGMEILDTSVNTISLDLSGSGTLIKSLQPDQIHVKLDLAGAVAGRNTFTITRENITLPPGVFLKKVHPPAVVATLDFLTKKKLPVQVDWVGKLPDHLTISDVHVDPSEVTVIGGRNILNRISTIYTEKVNVDNITRSGTLTVKLALNPASLKIDSDSQNRVNLRYRVRRCMTDSLKAGL